MGTRFEGIGDHMSHTHYEQFVEELRQIADLAREGQPFHEQIISLLQDADDVSRSRPRDFVVPREMRDIVAAELGDVSEIRLSAAYEAAGVAIQANERDGTRSTSDLYVLDWSQ